MNFLFPNKPTATSLQAIDRFDFSEWLVQPKWNGIRVLPMKNGDTYTLYNRYGKPLTKTHPKVVIDLPEPYLLDGELLSDQTIVIWDFAVLGGERFTHKTYAERLEILRSAFERMGTVGVSLVETKRAKFYKGLWVRMRSDERCEGLVFKRKDARDFWSFGNSSKELMTQLKYRRDRE